MKLGRYEVVRELGKGAMGIVYLAKDPLIGRLVALKTIRPANNADDDEAREFQQRFIREAQAAGILNHPAIVTVHDIGQDDASGVSFIAMEYVEGSNLKEVLAQGRPLTFEQIGDIIAQVAEGLDFAHAKGIVHRDVKPANIILIEGMRAKITDFGIAKIASGAANLTTTGQFLGTPNYMAPEQIKGTPVDGRTDIFSLGICLYECLTRRKPFGGDSLTSISYKIVHEPCAPLREINPQIPEGFEEVVSRALAKDPSKRYQRARDMANALRAVNRGERPVTIEPMMAEETVITRGGDGAPAENGAAEDGLGTQAVRAAAPAPVKPPRKAPAGAAAPAVRRPDNDLPVWKRAMHPALFLGIVTLLIVALGVTMLAMRRQVLPEPRIDRKAEAQRARERLLRTQGNEFIRQGRLTDAYDRFSQLNRIAPQSPAISALVLKLGALKEQEEVGKQQLALSKQKLDEGVKLYNAKKFAEAVPVLQQAFSLNPNDDIAANYLKFAQQEEQRVEAERAARQAALRGLPPPAAGTGRPGTSTATGTQHPAGGAGGAATVAPAQLNAVFNSPVADGTLLIRISGQVVVRENLWEERGRFLARRKYPRNVNVTAPITPANTDIHIWVIIPSMAIQEYKALTREVFAPGATRRLSITFDPKSKRFDYQLN